jgi:hypothetical protein
MGELYEPSMRTVRMSKGIFENSGRTTFLIPSRGYLRSGRREPRRELLWSAMSVSSNI